jgi:hypothetical protein
MRQRRIVLLWAVPIFTVAALGQGTKSALAPTIASTLDREIGDAEKEIVEAVEAMPADKFNFSPESLNLPCARIPSDRVCFRSCRFSQGDEDEGIRRRRSA